MPYNTAGMPRGVLHSGEAPCVCVHPEERLDA